MSFLPLFLPRGLPRNGLIAWYDPYRDVAGRNILPAGSDDFVTGWGAYGGATITVTPGQPDPDGGNNAYLIETSGGTDPTQYLISAAYTSGVYSMQVSVKNLSTNILTVRDGAYIGDNVSQVDNWKTCSFLGSTVSGGFKIQFRAPATGQSLRFLAYHPTLSLGSTLSPYTPPAGLPQTINPNLYLGSTTSTDTNDPILTGAGVKHTTNQYCLSDIVNMDLRSFSEIIVGKFDGTSGVIWSLADSTVTAKYQAIKQVSAGNVAIISCNGGTETQSINLAVSATDNVTLHFSASGGVLTLTNMATGASVTLADTVPVASAARIGVGCIAGSTVAQVISSMTWYNQTPYSRPLVSSESIRGYRYLKNIESGRGVAVA